MSDDFYPSDLPDLDPAEHASIEAREADHESEHGPYRPCAFLSVDTNPNSPPCPLEADSEREVEGVAMPACPTHRERGGILHRTARRRLVLELVARREIEATRTAVTDEGERVSFPRFCSGCGGRLYTGNTSGRCWECASDDAISVAETPTALDYEDVVFGSWPAQALASPPRFPWELDRHVYEAPGMAAWRAENLR